MSLTVLPSAQAAAQWLAKRCSGTLRSDSRQVVAGDALLAWPGAQRDGRDFVTSALAAGAAAAVVEAEGAEVFGLDATHVAALPGLKSQAGVLSSIWYDEPTAALRVMAVTGTNGKTSCAWWMAQALGLTGCRTGVVGTLGVGEPPALVSTGLTTPDPVHLQQSFATFRDAGFKACAIEASSIGLVEHRLDGTRIDTALLTNLTQDHLDYHGTMEAYWQAKRRLFDWPGLRAAVVNIDDAHGRRLAEELHGGPLELWTVSSRGPAILQAEGLTYGPAGLNFTVAEGPQCVSVQTALMGDFNVDNLLLVLGGLRAQGVSLAAAAAVLAQLSPVPGRLQRVPAADDQPVVLVDYAHTPDALQKVLQTLRPLAQARGGRLTCIFGCGGNRDAAKRPLMGALAAEGADSIWVTSDNPRQESPQAIVEHIVQGVPPTLRGRVDIELDRRMAIRRALRSAHARDVVLIAGKGHEDYQDIGGQRWPFSDAQVAREALEARESLEP